LLNCWRSIALISSGLISAIVKIYAVEIESLHSFFQGAKVG
jgi:hypothetical protein